MINNWNPWVLLIALSSFIAAFSQTLLKRSASEKHSSFLREYLNFKVVLAYTLIAGAMLLNIAAYSKHVTLISGVVTDSSSYLWVLLLSFLFFREPITPKKIFGNSLIISGILIANLF